MKVGRDKEDDIRRVRIARQVMGPNRRLMIDANQVWESARRSNGSASSRSRIRGSSRSRPAPTMSRDIALSARASRRCKSPPARWPNRVIFKQFIMRGAIDVVQINSCRLGGVNEILAVMLMAAKYDLPVCPHAGGVGLCEYVQHLSMIDYICISGTREGRVIEYVDHLHEHFEDPCFIANAAYMPPKAPGFSITMKPESLKTYEFKPNR